MHDLFVVVCYEWRAADETGHLEPPGCAPRAIDGRDAFRSGSGRNARLIVRRQDDRPHAWLDPAGIIARLSSWPKLDRTRSLSPRIGAWCCPPGVRQHRKPPTRSALGDRLLLVGLSKSIS